MAETRPAASAPAPMARLRAALPPELARRVASGRELARDRREERRGERLLPTGTPGLDRLLGGGLPRGRLVELVGGRSSGRFSLALGALAAATSAGEAAALVDLGDGLDPQLAAAAGAALDRLLWLRPTHLGQALAAAEMTLGTGFPLVVELGLPPIAGGRGPEAAWVRLARAARLHGGALLVSSPYRVSGTAAGAVLAAGRGRAQWDEDHRDDGDAGWGAGAGGRGRGAPSPRLLAGIAARLAIDKRRGGAEGEEAALRLAAPEAVVPPPDPAAEGDDRAETSGRGVVGAA